VSVLKKFSASLISQPALRARFVQSRSASTPEEVRFRKGKSDHDRGACLAELAQSLGDVHFNFTESKKEWYARGDSNTRPLAS
jgi:hypothetical protein